MTAATSRARHRFVVNSGRDMLEWEIDADDFEVAPEGVHFIVDQGKTTERVTSFVSHPCMVREDDTGEIASKRPEGEA